MSDPFKIDGPTCFSFSMGRSSGFALRKTLDANEPEVLRKYLKVLTCNTGKEEEAGLRFGDKVDREWLRPLGLSLTWLEYQAEPRDEEWLDIACAITGQDMERKWRVVTFAGASRNGEPFEAIITQRGGVLPNRVSRFCSSELKTRTMHRYLRSIGWTEWDTFIGVRADEPRRVAKFRANPHPEGKHEEVHLPLAIAGIGAQDVGAFWKAHSFDLELPNMNGKTMHGNCDLCFLKPAHQVFSLIAEKPSRAVWWAAQEKKAEQTVPPRIRLEPIFEKVEIPQAEYEAEMAQFESDYEAGEFNDLDEYELEQARPRRFELRPVLDAAGEQVVRRHLELSTACRFRDDRASYAQMAQYAADQRDAFGHEDEEAIACFCGD